MIIRNMQNKKKYMKKSILFIILTIFLVTCQKKNNETESQNLNSINSSSIVKQNIPKIKIDQGEEWLKKIFKNNNSDKYFPDYNVEEKLCSKRFQEFIYESGEIYGASNFTDEERDSAEIKYKEKWSKIYPIEKKEMWLFGRGNGDIGELKKIEITKNSDLKYNVFIDYGDDIKTKNIVTLIPENGSYKIDYCKTEFIK